MELRHLRYFVAVAEELHFTRAAERLGIAQPPLSQQIQQLEGELGTPLFERARRRVALTEAGKAVLAEAKAVLARADQLGPLARQTARGERGWLGVGFVGTAMYGRLPTVLHAYRTKFPRVELELSDMEPVAQIEALLAKKIHVAFVRALERSVQDQPLVAYEAVQREPLIAALPDGHALARRKQLPLVDLAGEPFIMFGTHPYYTFTGVIRAACQAAGFTPDIVQHTRDIHTALGLVAAGLGVSLVPASIGTLHRPGVSFRPLLNPAPTTELLVVHRRDDEAVPTVSAFLSMVRDVMRKAGNPK
jgi:DNA-binding transcriptional LysR family regulator